MVNSIFQNKGNMRYAAVRIVKPKDKVDIKLENIREVYFPFGRKLPKKGQKTCEAKYIVIRCQDTSYLVFSKGRMYRERELFLIDVGGWFDCSDLRHMKLKDSSFCRYRKSESGALHRLEINNKEMQIVLHADDLDGMELIVIK